MICHVPAAAEETWQGSSRTIVAMKIRAVTLGMDFPAPRVDPTVFASAGRFLAVARDAFEADGLPVQTTRLAGPDLGPTLARLDGEALRVWATETERAATEAGVQYLSLGRIPAEHARVVERHAAPIIAAGEAVFLSADLLLDGRVHVPMAAACARVVRQLAHGTRLGFGNLRFAATASCPPNIPFLPAAYHAGGRSQFAVAVQAADVVLDAARGAGTPEEVEARIVEWLEVACRPIEETAERLAQDLGVAFVGIDLSPAPYPSEDVSIGGAIEAVGVDRFGAPGTLYVAAMLARAIRRTRVRRSGFSGLMLPVLEDAVLARRATTTPSSLHELLLYSAVCGTGLDTIPLPGDVAEAELAGAFLDVAALSAALGGKPLTVRLLPVPGARAGDMTTYDFEFFQNARVAPASGGGAAGVLHRAGAA